MSLVDWGLIRVQYETLGCTVEQLVDEFGVSKSMIEYAIEEQGWKPMPICDAVQDWRDVDQVQDIGEELITEVQDRMRIIQTVKQSTLSPKYIALETAILGKGLEVIRAIRPEAPQAAAQLKQITEVLQTLTPNRPAGVNPTEKQGVTVKVLSHVGPEGTAQVGAEVAITKEVSHVADPECHA